MLEVFLKFSIKYFRFYGFSFYKKLERSIGKCRFRSMSKNNKKSQASWGGRFAKGPSELMLKFSESISFDKLLAEFDVQGSTAHAKMLAEVGIITKKECATITAGLQKIIKQIRAGKFEWQESLEDVHMNIEQALTKDVPAAAKLHTARSRNDQVATDMRLFFKYACSELKAKIEKLIIALVDLADANRDILIPGYTHLQRAQPVSAAHHILAWVEMFARDLERFSFCAEAANVSPLGSGAIAGTTLPIERSISAAAMGFVDSESGDPILTGNSMDAVADRDVFLEFAFNCALFGTHLSRVSEDVIIWNTSEFAFVALPDEFTTGSSLMPQKKNPDAFELMRGKSARLLGNLNTLFALTKGLPLTYNRDLQEDKPPVFDSFAQVSICAEVMAECAKRMKFNAKKCADAVADPLLLATDLADYFVMCGVPFRNAHHMVGALVALSEKKNVPINELSDADVFAVCDKAKKDWRNVFDLKRAFAMREKIGMPGFEQTKAQIAAWREVFGK